MPLDTPQLITTLSNANARWFAKVTPQSLLSSDDQRRLLGAEASPELLAFAANRPLLATVPTFAPAVDWRNRNGNHITPIKDQGGCGSCVSFASVALVEAMANIELGLGLDLSEADSHFCSSHGASCGGWWPDACLDQYISRGVCEETDFPYASAFPGNNIWSGPPQCHVAPDRDLRTAKIASRGSFADAASAKNYLSSTGPLAGCFTVYEDFFNYSTGVYHHVTGAVAGGHCVLIIGYSEADQCWIAKNSWGPGWGDNGFFKIAYSDFNYNGQFLPMYSARAVTAPKHAGFLYKVTLPDTTPVSPALASLNGRLYLGWKGDGNDSLNVEYTADDAHSFGNKHTFGDTSPFAPALCEHNGNLYIAWKGDGNNNLNVAVVTISGTSITGLTQKVTLGETSSTSPTLASLNGRLYLGWKGNGNDELNVASSTNNGQSFGNKFTSAETSPVAPALGVHNGSLYISWKGDGNNFLNVALVSLSGNSITGLTQKVTLGDTSPVSPSLASLNGRLYLAWKGGGDLLNVMFSADNGHTFGNKYISSETSPVAPSLSTLNGNLYIAWKGDGNDLLNVARVVL